MDPLNHLADAIDENRQRREIRQLPRLRNSFTCMKRFMPGEQCAVGSVNRIPAINEVFQKSAQHCDFIAEIERVRVGEKAINALFEVFALDPRIATAFNRCCPAV
jgi:hypothetical protein